MVYYNARIPDKLKSTSIMSGRGFHLEAFVLEEGVLSQGILRG